MCCIKLRSCSCHYVRRHITRTRVFLRHMSSIGGRSYSKYLIGNNHGSYGILSHLPRLLRSRMTRANTRTSPNSPLLLYLRSSHFAYPPQAKRPQQTACLRTHKASNPFRSEGLKQDRRKPFRFAPPSLLVDMNPLSPLQLLPLS